MAQRMPDLRSDNSPVSLGEAMKLLETLGIPAPSVFLKVESTTHTSQAEIVAQEPAPQEEILEGRQVVLTVSSRHKPALDLPQLLGDLASEIEFGSSPQPSQDLVARLFQQFEIELKRSQGEELTLVAHLKNGLAHAAVEIPPDLANLLDSSKSATHSDTAAVDWRSIAKFIRREEVSDLLEPCFSHGSRAEIQSQFARFAFFESSESESTETRLTGRKRENWLECKSAALRLIAAFEQIENRSEEELLDWFYREKVAPALESGFLVSRSGRGSPSLSELFSETERRFYAEAIRRSAMNRLKPRDLGRLVKGLFHLPNDPEVMETPHKTWVEVPEQLSELDRRRLAWLDFWFRPLELDVEYGQPLRPLVLDRADAELDKAVVG